MHLPTSSNARAIVLENVSKRFRVVSIPKHASFKETIVRLDFLKRKKRDQRFVEAVRNVSFSVARAETLGIIGKNGSGKSTLMRLLAGIYEPDTGSVAIAGEIAPLLSLGIGFHPDMTGRENIRINGLVLGLAPAEIEQRYLEIVAFSELEEFIDFPIRTYSSGMYMFLAFAVAINVDPDVLLLDEVLSVGDEAFSEKCRIRMRAFKDAARTIVLVSHDAGMIRQWCDTAVWLDHGAMRMFGPANDVVDAYHRELHVASNEAALIS